MHLRAVFFIGFIFLSYSLSAKELQVCSDCGYTAVKEAVAAAQTGDVVVVHSGTYSEGTIFISKAITILGEGGPIFDGQGEFEVFTVQHDSVRIQGVTIQNIGASYTEDRSGIRVVKSDYFDIRENTLLDAFFGIFIEGGKHGNIVNNKVFGEAIQQINSGNAIHIWHAEDILVQGNHVRKHRDGIYFEFVDHSRIFDNVSENNLRYGLHFMFSNDDEYSHNEFKNNGAGVAVMFSKEIYMYNNDFRENWGDASYGLLLKEIYDGEISGNHFYKNTIGINAEGSNRLNLHDNNFERNGWALRVLGACFDNQIEHNNFLYNTFDVAYQGGMNGNSFEGNYWSEYTGYDLDRDGIGDVPFRPVKLFSYVVNKVPESIILIRSLFVDVINFSEKVTPVFTPDELMDNHPLMFTIE